MHRPPDFDVLLFTTCDLGGGRLDDLTRLLTSLRQAEAQEGIRILHYVLLQRLPGRVPAELTGDLAGGHTHWLPYAQRFSLSRARNLMLRQARGDGALSRVTWVAFPDDDAWYPPGLLRHVNQLFLAREQIGMVTCSYASKPRKVGDGARGFSPLSGSSALVRTVSSNTLMLRAKVVQATGFFDERLGVGASINGGEDLDYALRAHVGSGMETLLSPDALVGHRDRVPWVRSRYFAGSLFALVRSARHHPGIAWQALRKLMVGAALVATRELPLRDAWRGLRTGLSGWVHQAPEVS